jgi:lysyl-tRNA synthetase class 2
MLEWYAARTTLEELIAETHALIRAVHDALTALDPGLTRGALVDVNAPLEAGTCAELFERHARVDLRAALARMHAGAAHEATVVDADAARALVDAARAAGLSLRPGADFEDAFFAIMGERVEPAIGRAQIAVVTEWPAQMAALARTSDDGLTAKRFEMYAAGIELCNAYDELVDPVEQRARFAADNAKRRALDKPELPVDEEFLAALARCPPMCGNALGVDRLLMVLTGARDIGDVVLE